VPLVIILDRISDVRNLGAIIRTAECAGVHAVIIPSKGSAQINAHTIKASAGAVHKVNICRHHNLKDVIRYLKNSGLRIFSVSEKAQKLVSQADISAPAAMILGSEDTGISPEYIKLSDEHIKIPIKGSIPSLNVSVAAGVILFEVLRQRDFK